MKRSLEWHLQRNLRARTLTASSLGSSFFSRGRTPQVTNPNAPVPASVKRVVAREDPRQLLKTLLTCSSAGFSDRLTRMHCKEQR